MTTAVTASAAVVLDVKSIDPVTGTALQGMMASGYMAVLQGMPEPQRSQMLHGDFLVGHEDQPLKGEWLAAAPADPQAPGETHLFRVTPGNLDRTQRGRATRSRLGTDL